MPGIGVSQTRQAGAAREAARGTGMVLAGRWAAGMAAAGAAAARPPAGIMAAAAVVGFDPLTPAPAREAGLRPSRVWLRAAKRGRAGRGPGGRLVAVEVDHAVGPELPQLVLAVNVAHRARAGAA